MAAPRTTPITVGVLALQGAFKEHLQLLRSASEELISSSTNSDRNPEYTFNFIEVRTPADLSKCNALIIPGGESTAISLVASRNGLLEPLRDFVKVQKRPTWGTCAGLILLSESANRTKKGGQDLIGGLDVRVNRNHFGRQVESFVEDIELPFLSELEGLGHLDGNEAASNGSSTGGTSFKGIFIRAPVVEEVLSSSSRHQNGETNERRQNDVEQCVTAPPAPAAKQINGSAEGGSNLNSSEDVKIMARLGNQHGRSTRNSSSKEDAGGIVAVQQGNVFGTSFHPELSGDSRIHRWWLEQVVQKVITPTPDHGQPSERSFIPTLPEEAMIDYLAEGAANVAYRISFPPSSPALSSSSFSEYGPNTPPPTEVATMQTNPLFHRRLLRLRKSIPSSQPTLQTFEAFQAIIAPLFPSSYLVEQDLVKLPPNLLSVANAGLRNDEETGKRPASRKGVYLALDEPFGVLVKDMTPDHERGEVSVEFKAKWLAQSPSAPADARRCRTCALRAMRRRGGIHSLKDTSAEEELCPLDLVSDDRSRVEVAVRSLLSSSSTHHHHGSGRLTKTEEKDTKGLEERLVRFLYKHPLLGRLKDLQEKFDSLGPLKADLKGREWALAMTLRDCTVFLKIQPPRHGPAGGEGRRTDPHENDNTTQITTDDAEGDEMKDEGIEIRLGDLDLKTPKGGKAAYWRGIEEELINGGWYTATETSSSSQLPNGGGGDGGVVGDNDRMNQDEAHPHITIPADHGLFRGCHALLAGIGSK
ncbi:MAG: hypothetical protein M1823_003964 [Watsoniomyces obsoletus]|nr:MAG: hypothetical protein M1823_003964 [Watsoniomyces obsoletus]